MMKKFISAILVCALLTTTFCTCSFATGKFFYDVRPDLWAYDYIMTMVENKILYGYEDNTFRPNYNVSRCEFAKMMASFTENPYDMPYATLYADVSIDAWFAPYVNVVKEHFNTKTENGKEYFMPYDDATREDVAVALVKFLGYAPSENTTDLDNAFSDSGEISASSKPYIAVAVEKNLIKGYQDNTFRPHGTLTRAEAATLLFRAFNFETTKIAYDVYPDTIAETFGSFANVGISETFTENNIHYIKYDEIRDENREYTVFLDYLEYLMESSTLVQLDDSAISLYCPIYIETATDSNFYSSFMSLAPTDTEAGYQVIVAHSPIDYNGKPCTIYPSFPAIDITSISSLKLTNLYKITDGIEYYYTYTNEDITQIVHDFVELNKFYGAWEISDEYEYKGYYVIEMKNTKDDIMVIIISLTQNELYITLMPAK